ncbi:hypothetical protein ACFYOG_21215 [Streptomyces sp. NPDC007818]|uniref:hypothetical protein n=1 Tax=Streptomyces sp. NPDC007818 TaxID=3364780 RepID=UPI003699A0AF
MQPSPLTRLPARFLAAGLLSLTAVLVPATTAAAHPFGTPPVARVVADGTVAEVTWSAEPDDLDVLRETAGEAGPAAYLRTHVAVSQRGATCASVGVDADALDERGAVLRFRCPAPVDEIALAVTALTDVDAAYRTLSVTTAGSGGLHTKDAPTRVLVLSGGTAGSPDAAAGLWTEDLAGLLDGGVFLPVALAAAVVMGATHACAPGHGKTLAAGYLVGGRGRRRDAVWLGAVVALMHTVSVAVLGVGWWLAAAHAPDIGMVTRWLHVAAGVIVVAVGLVLLRRHLRAGRHAHPAESRKAHHHHHQHGHSHSHSHDVIPPRALLTRRGIVLLGTSGGLLPSPSAFLVLLSGLLTGRAGAALLLVAAFGAGMALAPASVGLAVVHGRDALLARASAAPFVRTWSRRAPLLAAAAVTLSGATATALAVGAALAG